MPELSSLLGNISASTLIAGMLFSTVGVSVWMYGKKKADARPMLLGAALVGVPFVLDDVALWCAGVVLTVLVFWP